MICICNGIMKREGDPVERGEFLIQKYRCECGREKEIEHDFRYP